MDTDDAQRPPSSRLTRRDFLKRSGISVAGASLAGAAAPYVHARAAPTEIVFTAGPDESGTLESLLDAFNLQHDDIQVRWRTMPSSSNAHFHQLQSELDAGTAEADVLAADVVWTAELAQNGWVADLSQRFHSTYNPEDFLYEALGSASHQFRIWGVPWYTDAGMLFYRRDLLLRNDFTSPPSTWDELKQMAQVVRNQEDVDHGFVFQGDAYEGGVTNACEYIWNAGGRIMAPSTQLASESGGGVTPPNTVNIDTPEAARGFDIARSLITDGVTPPTVTSLREEDTWELFMGGQAVFMRNWPFAYNMVHDPSVSELSPEQIGIAPVPAADANRPHYSCLGGWNLMISGATVAEKRDAAWTFIQFATSPAQQKNRALGGGFLPSLRALYEDPEVEGAIPVIDLGRTAIRNARARPATPFYSQMSPRIANAFTRTLRGEQTGEEATRQLARELREILIQN